MASKSIGQFSQLIQKIAVVFLLSGGILLTPQPIASQTIDQLFQQGNAAQEAGNYAEAERIWNQLLQRDPDNADAYFNLGNALSDQGKLDEAVAAYNKAIEINPEDAIAYNNLGIALSDQGKLDEALLKCQQALNLPDSSDVNRASDHTFAHNCIGWVLQKQGKYEEALVAFDKAIALDPDWPQPRNNKRETQRLIVLRRKPQPQPEYIDDTAWLPPDDPDVPLLRSVVRIITETYTGGEEGTGWVIKKEGQTAWILTVRHVVIDRAGSRQPSEKIEVDFYSEPPIDEVHRRQTAELLEMTERNDEIDLALLKVTNVPEDVQPLPIINQRLSRGAIVWVIGHPKTGDPWTMETGEISNPRLQSLQISDATIAEGHSGGPVLNEERQVIGILVEDSGSDYRQNPGKPPGFSFAYPIEYIEHLIQEWGML